MKKIFSFVLLPIIWVLVAVYVLNTIVGLPIIVLLNMIMKKSKFLTMDALHWGAYIIWPFFLFSLIVFAKYTTKQSSNDLGFIKENKWKDYLIGIILGFLVIAITYVVNYFIGSFTKISLTFNKDVILFGVISLIVFMFQGMAEEVMFRSILFKSEMKFFKTIWFPILINGALFTIAHGANPGMGIVPRIQLVQFSIVCSFMMLNTKGSLWMVGAFHSFWNFFQFEFGSLVSGNKLGNSFVNINFNNSMSLYHGGEFGFEGGIIVNIILLIAIIGFVINHIRIKGNYAK